MVTEGCQGCLEHPCMEVCPRGAISMVNGRSHIDEEKCIKCGKCQDACPYNAIIKQERPCKKACGRVWAFYGWLSLVLFVLSYLLTVLGALLLVLLERGRIRRVGAGKLAAAVALWPFFLLINVFLDVAALFLRDLEWKAIPHVGTPALGRAPAASIGEIPTKL